MELMLLHTSNRSKITYLIYVEYTDRESNGKDFCQSAFTTLRIVLAMIPSGVYYRVGIALYDNKLVILTCNIFHLWSKVIKEQ